MDSGLDPWSQTNPRVKESEKRICFTASQMNFREWLDVYRWFSWVILTWHAGTLQMNNPDVYVQGVCNHELGICFFCSVHSSINANREIHTQKESTYTRTYMFTTVTFKMSHMSHTNISLYYILSQSGNHVLEDALGTCHCLWLVRCLVQTCKVLHLPKGQGNVPFFSA